MSKQPIILDIETKYSFRQRPQARNLEVSVACIYDYKSDKTNSFREESIGQLFTRLENASYIIGYNIDHFDFAVLQAYYPGDLFSLPTFDLCTEMKTHIGFRPALGDLLAATLGAKKTGHGLIAIDLYKEGRWDELTEYCLSDVLLTRDLFNFGLKHGYVNYLSSRGKEKVPVSWKKYLTDRGTDSISLTLPF